MTFARLLSEATASGALPRTGDLLSVGLPLLRQIDGLHREGRVTGASGVSAIAYDGESVSVTSSQLLGEQHNRRAVDSLSARAEGGGLAIAARRHVDLDARSIGGGPWTAVRSDDVFDPHDADSPSRPDRPMFVVGYRAWEQLLGHHDQLTDIHLVGLWLSSYAFGLDLATPEGAHELALHHRHPSRLNPDLHPVVLNVLSDLVQPSRAKRPTDLSHVIARLEHHRDLPTDLDLGPAYAPDVDWRRQILTILRDRVFDTTRRNRQLYFRSTASSVSLTEASVPLMLNVDRIKPDDLLTWTDPANRRLRNGKSVDLAQWCRFEETPYLAPTLAKLISAERKVRLETGHSRLRLIIAFLHWRDPETGETISSPLLLMPAELTRKKGITVRFQLTTGTDEATVNPVLRHVFKSRFDISLPMTVGADPEAVAGFVAELERQVQATAPEVSIELVDKPRIELLRRQARLRVDNYRRRRAKTLAASGRWRRQDHSYDHDDWRPLGLALYRRFVEETELPLRELVGAAPRPRRQSALGEGVLGERTSMSYTRRMADVSAERWEVDLCSVTLAMLGSRRTSLARDYDEVLDADGLGPSDGASPIVAASPFDVLFSPDRSAAAAAPTKPLSLGQQLVLPADDAQARAVQRAVRGDSFIIQGPPGTGKSQTITNVIAALVADGKRVLFVCEKRAAIDVVAHRLRQVGLGELTATIHDSQLDRKQFVKELGATYHRWLEGAVGDDGPDAPVSPAEEHRAGLLAEAERVTRPLEAMVAELGRSVGDRMPVGEAVERLAVLRARTGRGAEAPRPAVDGLTSQRWLALRPALNRVVDALAVTGSVRSVGDHVPLRIRPSVIAGRDTISVCRRVGAELRSAASAVVADGTEAVSTVDTHDRAALGQVTRADLDAVADFAPAFRQALSVGPAAVAALDPQSPAHLDLRAAARDLEARRVDAIATATVLDRWSPPLGPTDTAAGLALAREKEGSLFGFLNGRWRSLRKLVAESYRFDQHKVAPTVVEVLKELAGHHEANAAVMAAEQGGLQRHGTTDVIALRDLVDRYHDHPVFGSFVAAGPRVATRIDELSELASVASAVLVDGATTVADLAAIGRSLEATPVALEPALVSWSTIGVGHELDLIAVLDADTTLDGIEAAVLGEELDRWSATIDHASFSGARLDDAVARLAGLYRGLLDANAAVVLDRSRSAFAANIAQSEASMAGRSDANKARKKAYNAGRRIVEREYDKKMRFRSIREMAGGDSGVVVRDLRPIWLMSPLSVSDTLPLDEARFDAVIFDEASQIPVEDAVPTVFRAPQVIVVGDRMQMPPTRFFSSADDDDESGVVVDEEGFRLSITLDADSFLTQADHALDSALLNWHYRSRSEALIAYSNHAFYQARLATVPDTTDGSPERPPIVVSGVDDAVAGVEELLVRPISHHFCDHGTYENRRNRPEADYVAELVRGLLRHRHSSGTDESDAPTIGVVAFSEAQQSAIEDSLDELATIDPDFAERYERELVRTSDDEFVGLFVKNLENVQGDERDIIIMSVCYGPAADGRIRMNFGPINNVGGERRLNVIFSRAKRHMAVVASMRGSDITNVHNEGARHLAGFLRYAEAESIGDRPTAQAVLEAQVVDLDGSPAVGGSAVAAELAARLVDRGLAVETSVGRSSFRIDVAVVNGSVDSAGVGERDDRRLGVLLEPAPDAPVHARFVAEAGVLEAFGWRILRVPLSDWYADPDRVVDRIVAALGPRSAH